MGLNYNQYCILGVCIPQEELEIELSPEQTESQPRYDTKTGKVSHYETVTVKKGEKIYRFEDLEDDYFPELAEKINKKYPDLYCSYNTIDKYYDDPYMYFGFSLGESDDYDRVDLLSGEICFDRLEELRNLLIEKFPEYKNQVKIYFFSSVG